MKIDWLTYEDWQAAYEQIKDSINQKKDYAIEINIDAEKESQYITQLRFLFPLAVHLYQEKIVGTLNPLCACLNINSSIYKKPDKCNTAFRLRRLLDSSKNGLDFLRFEVLFNGKSADWFFNISDTRSASRIFPIMQVGNRDKLSDSLFRSVLDYRSLNSVIYSSTEGRNSYDTNNSLIKIANASLAFIRDEENYVGYNDSKRSISAANKDKLRDQMEDLLRGYLVEMSILAQAIWLFLVIEMIKSKQIFDFDTGESVSLRYDLLEKSRMDAIAYADGLYQLIENACLHSTSHLAWFGMRLFPADREASMGSFSKEAGYRQFLYSKYDKCFLSGEEQQTRASNNIFNCGDHEYKAFLEFYVADDTLEGAVTHYNKGVFEQSKDKVFQLFQKEEERDWNKPTPPNDFQELSSKDCALWMRHMKALSADREVPQFQNELGDLFHLPIREKYIKEHVEDTTVHYGLRMLRRIASVNHGYIVGKTPDLKSTTLLYYNGNVNESVPKDDKKPSYCTSWEILIPVDYQWEREDFADLGCTQRNCFGSQVERPRTQLRMLYANQIFHMVQAADKREDVKAAGRVLAPLISDLDNIDDSVSLFRLDAVSIYEIEIFSKALFGEIAKSRYKSIDTPPALRLAILFNNKIDFCEFLRFFAVFYPNGLQADMEAVQIALCCLTEDDRFDVMTVLAGKTLRQAYQCARTFTYHHADSALDFLPLLGYLTKVEAPPQTEEDIPLFPFDLALPAELPASTNGKLDWCNNWFIQRMERVLQTDLQSSKLGCKIENIHIRLGSKIHFTEFFQAELLFHNMGNVARFAYMVAQQLLYGEAKISEGNAVLLLGYEKYSAQLLLQVQELLQASQKFTRIVTAIVSDGSDDKQVNVKLIFDENEADLSSEPNLQSVIVLPVGTTLSTIYKIRNAVSRHTDLIAHINSSETNFPIMRVFSLIVVNEELEKGRELSTISRRYWESVDRDRQVINLQKETSGEAAAQVHYFIHADARWLDPQDCPVCKKTGNEMVPIIGGKNSNTSLTAIFPLHDKHAGGFKCLTQEKKANPYEKLKGNVICSHLYYGNNHFQFYIDYQKLFLDNKDEIEKELSSIKIEQNGFHVIVSPLQLTNATFVKSVIDCVFHGKVRFLNIDILGTYREEMRSKFSYLSLEFHELRRINPKARLCFHYVDTTIVTGTQLHRARLLLQTLLNQSLTDYSDIPLFDSIFLLVNRSSWDSISSFVRPVSNDTREKKSPEQRLYAYIHLTIPSYNTENDFCPACQLVSKYELLEKRSSSENLSWEFMRLKEKHQKRLFADYKRWLEESILESGSHFGWLRLWLYVNVPEGNERILSFVGTDRSTEFINGGDDLNDVKNVRNAVNELIQHLEEEAYGSNPTDPQKLLEIMERTSIKRLEDNINNKGVADAASRLLRDYPIAERAYIRLESLQRSYEELDTLFNKDHGCTAENAREAMLSAINKSILSVPVSASSLMGGYLSGLPIKERNRFLIARNGEWLISFIKVLSRPQLANYYPYRQAISGIMSEMLSALLASVPSKGGQGNTRLGKIGTYIEGISSGGKLAKEHPQLCAYMCYQIVMTLQHRMADLQINARVVAEELTTLLDFYRRMEDLFFLEGGKLILNFPSFEQALLRYLKSMKAAVMLTNDDIPCLQLVNTAERLERLAQNRTPSDFSEDFHKVASYLFLENTRMMYTGMQELEKRVSANILNTIDEYRPCDDFKNYMDLLNEDVETCLQKAYANMDHIAKNEDLLYQNVLANFCRFYQNSTHLPPVTETSEAAPRVVNRLTYIFQYFRRLRTLAPDGPRSLPNDDLPYLYEELCRTICGFSGFQMVYIVHHEEGNLPEIFAQSGYHVNLMRQGVILNPAKAGELISRSQFISDNLEGENGRNWIPGVSSLPRDGYDYLLIHIPAYKPQSKREGFFLILQATQTLELLKPRETDIFPPALQIARNILFMREKLRTALLHDCTILISYRFDCSYVRQLGIQQSEHPVIMHISDLHIKEDMSSRLSDIQSKLKDVLDGCGSRDRVKVDLLAISGDLVDCRDANAGRMEQNYGYAQAFLDGIVQTLWQDSMGYLPHDWKRRIIITTGNHDYASMNQYQAVLKLRSLASAMPAEGDSGTMAKFSYYIDFLIRYLDVPIHEMLEDDLNYVRYYKKMKMKVLALNCSSLAAPRRTNKMGVNRKKVEEILEREHWGQKKDENGNKIFHLVVAHYSPDYELSYFIDNYQPIVGWKWDDVNKRSVLDAIKNCDIKISERYINYVIWCFVHAVTTEWNYYYLTHANSPVFSESKLSEYRIELQKVREQFSSEFDALQEALNTVPGNPGPDPISGYYVNWISNVIGGPGLTTEKKKARLKVLHKKLEENNLYNRVVQYRNWLCDNDDWNEVISQISYEVNESITMGMEDKEAFLGVYNNLINCVSNNRIQRENVVNLYLAGHIHAYSERDGIILVADKMIDDYRDDIRGYLIYDASIKNGKGNPYFTKERFK